MQPGLGDASPDVQAVWGHVATWFRACCTLVTQAGADVNSVGITPPALANPAQMFATQAWFSECRHSLNLRAGVGGPQLTTTAFNAGIADLQTTMNNVATQRLAFERARASRSFTEKHGEALAQRMHRLCGVVDDEHLPDVLKLLAKAPAKDQDYAIIGNAFRERAEASPVPLSSGQAPLATPTAS